MVDYLLHQPYCYLLLTLASSYFITFSVIPVVIRVAREKHLLERPNVRSSHTQETPSLGGIAIFAALSIVFLLMTQFAGAAEKVPLLFPSLVILFFIGLKDDILVIDPYKKLIAQCFAAGLFIACTNIRIGNLFGLLGVYELSYLTSFLLTTLVIVIIINAYNLIDGIDGLAGSLGIVTALLYGVYFYATGLVWAVVLCATLVGSLIGFLRFNFSFLQKVFMGDSGSLIVGFILAVLAITFIQMNEMPHPLQVRNAPTIAIVTLAIPLFDTLRVFSHRLLQGIGPFQADRNHIHHFVIDNGHSHFRASLLLSGISLVLAVSSYLFFAQASVTWSFAGLIVGFMLYSFIIRRNGLVRRPHVSVNDFIPHQSQKQHKPVKVK